MKAINILIIDDHPIIADAYKSALTKITQEDDTFQFSISEANTIDKALLELSKKTPFNLIFLDIKLPKSKDNRFLSGEDLGLEIRRVSPTSKIIVATTYNDNYRLNNILKSINPDGFIIKNDITPNELVNAIETVLDKPPYYSKTVLQLLRKQFANNFNLDKIDRQILFELSKGTKMVDMPNKIPMSIGGIERRKRQLKELFGIVKEEDKILVQMAIEKGFV
ncbi:response regulator transcription factor [Lacinutrix neustonica]|uniref:Response regulator transcription factor n=1 Tax=Lacinutrix neustonica TaxID=2980107 RepID=A0A9E8MTT7_9FLAO|nr:response regulator transcription factor [Lacinutrix neustonica]WAC01196.1 response regulator transcription factor [Lacinutrix neustonica]